MVNLRPTIRLALSSLKRKFPSVDKPLRILAPPKISPSKRAFEKCKPRGLFSGFYGRLSIVGIKVSSAKRFLNSLSELVTSMTDKYIIQEIYQREVNCPRGKLSH